VLVGSGTKANKLEAVKVTRALLRCTSISVGPDLLIDNQMSSIESESTSSHPPLRNTIERYV
jgi:hypothetical protein